MKKKKLVVTMASAVLASVFALSSCGTTAVEDPFKDVTAYNSATTTLKADSAVDALGTISFIAKFAYTDEYGDSWTVGKKVVCNQLVGLEYLDYLIDKGSHTMLEADRKPIYEEALNILALLNIEIPTYQRKDWSVYNHDVVDESSLTWKQTTYYGILSEIWNLKLKNTSVDNLVIQQSTYSEVFNPFFSSSAYDTNIYSMANISLVSADEYGSIVAGPNYPSVAESYNITANDDDTTTYKFVIKNGVKFSDGTSLTMDDVLFSLYTYLDPAYDGSGTLYSIDIQGLDEYRTQVSSEDSAEITKTANAIRAAGFGYAATANDTFTQAQYDFFWNMAENYGTTFSQNIINYVMDNYCDDDFIADNFSSAFKAADVSKDTAHKNAFALCMWGFGSLNKDKHIIGASGKDYGAFGGDMTISVADYWLEVKAKYTKDNVVNYEEIFNKEAANDADKVYLDKCVSAAVSFIGASKGNHFDSVSGIKTSKESVGGVEHDVLTITINGQSPTAIYQFSVPVTSKKYYTDGFTYREGAIVNGGVQLGLNSDGSPDSSFMDQLKTKNNKPFGAGAYIFDNYENNVVYFSANPYFYTVSGKYTSNEAAVSAYTTAMAACTTDAQKQAVKGIHNAYIPNISMPVIASGTELSSLETGAVHIATVSASKTEVSKVNAGLGDDAKLSSILTDYLGYGYIAINANMFNNIYERTAVKSVFDVASAVKDYYGDIADPIYRSMSLTNWAAPEYTNNASSDIYPYDSSVKTSLAYFMAAGYTRKDGKLVDKDGKQFTVTLTLPMEADTHPAGKIFTNAKTLLEKIGCKVELVIDTNLISDIKTGTTDVYALAWQATIDPDMTQVYSIRSQADSPVASGIIGLYNKLVSLSTRTKVAG